MSDEYGYNQQQYNQQQTYQQPQGGYSQSYGQAGYGQAQGAYAPPPPPPMNYAMASQPVRGSGWATLLRVTCWILGVLLWIGGIGVFVQAQEPSRYASYFDTNTASSTTAAAIGSLLVFVLFGLIVIAAGNLAANHYKLTQQMAANTNYLLNQSLQNRQ